MIKKIENARAFLNALSETENIKIGNFSHLTSDEAEGYVYDEETTYHVTVYKRDINESTCSCHDYMENGICKHIIKLYYGLFSEEFDDDIDKVLDAVDDIDEVIDPHEYNLPLYYQPLMEKTLNDLSKDDLIDLIIEHVKLWKIAPFNDVIDEYRNTFKNKDVGDNPTLIVEQLYLVMKQACEEMDDEERTVYTECLTREEKEQIKFLLKVEDSEYIKDLEYALITTGFCGHPLFNEFLKPVLEYFEHEELVILENLVNISIEHFSSCNDHYFLSHALITKHLINEMMDNVDIKEDVKDCFMNHKSNLFIQYIFNYYIDNFDELIDIFEEEMIYGDYSRNRKEQVINKISEIVKNDKVNELKLYCDVIFNGDKNSLNKLLKTNRSEEYIEQLIKNASSRHAKVVLYRYFDKKEELLKLVMKDPKGLYEHISYLKDEYNEDLLDYFVDNVVYSLKPKINHKRVDDIMKFINVIIRCDGGVDIVKRIYNLITEKYPNNKYLLNKIEKLIK